jgi:hypothetical protein
MTEKEEKGKKEVDEELDISSPNFNPLRALTELQIPKQIIKFDNLSIFESKLKTAGNDFEKDVSIILIFYSIKILFNKFIS